MNLKELANRANKTSMPAADPAALVQKAKAASGATATKKKAPVIRLAVDDAWVVGLAEKANAKFGSDDRFAGAVIEFTVAKSKGRMVSMTPKLVYADGQVKSAGSKRVGFCTNEKWDVWYEKLEVALVTALTNERKTAAPRKMSGRWAPYAEALRSSDIKGIEVKSVSGKLSAIVADEEGGKSRVTMKVDGGAVVVSSASGPISFVHQVLTVLSTVLVDNPTNAEPADDTKPLEEAEPAMEEHNPTNAEPAMEEVKQTDEEATEG